MDRQRSLSRDEVRAIDSRAMSEFGLPGIMLMENAGRGAAELLHRLGVTGRVVICAGKGNNGGDGFVIARHLDLAGCDVRVLLCCDRGELTGDAAINYGVLEAAGMAGIELGMAPDATLLARELAAAEWIIDALLGTGARGEVRAPYLSVIAAINHAGKKVLAVDLPSGMDCDTGLPLGVCVQAHHTATFVARKLGFDAAGSRAWTGEVHVIGIGAPRKLLEDVLGATSVRR